MPNEVDEDGIEKLRRKHKEATDRTKSKFNHLNDHLKIGEKLAKKSLGIDKDVFNDPELKSRINELDDVADVMVEEDFPHSRAVKTLLDGAKREYNEYVNEDIRREMSVKKKLREKAAPLIEKRKKEGYKMLRAVGEDSIQEGFEEMDKQEETEKKKYRRYIQ